MDRAGRDTTRSTALRAGLGFAALMVAGALAGCGGGSSHSRGTDPSARAAASPTEPDVATTVSSGAHGGTGSPVANRTAFDRAAGRALVQAQCAACHALADAGISAPTNPLAPALDGIGSRRSRAFLEITLVTPCAHAASMGRRYSCKRMPSYAGLTPSQRDQIVLYLLSQR